MNDHEAFDLRPFSDRHQPEQGRRQGNTSREALFPFLFPRRRRYIERTTLRGSLPGRRSRSPLGPTVGPADTETTTAHGRKGLVTVKIEAMNGETPEPFEYGKVFAREEVGGRARLRVGLDEAQDAAVATLARTLRGPFQLLYVLHTTRTAAELGRYESPELTSADVELFLSEFGRFLREDSRHDLWLRSHDDDATIVFDRHNLIFAYGPLELFERELQSSGAREGEPAVLGAHVHHYHPDWDDEERGVLRRFEWRVTPLRPSDVQFDPERDRSK